MPTGWQPADNDVDDAYRQSAGVDATSEPPPADATDDDDADDATSEPLAADATDDDDVACGQQHADDDADVNVDDH